MSQHTPAPTALIADDERLMRMNQALTRERADQGLVLEAFRRACIELCDAFLVSAWR